MSDFGTMIERIKRTTKRPEAEQEIKEEIISAVDEYRTSHFRFNEIKFLINTVADQYLYDTVRNEADDADISVTDLVEIDFICWADSTGMLRKTDYQTLEAINASGRFVGRPWRWGFNRNKIILSSIPTEVYVLAGFGVHDFSTLDIDSADNYTDAWFTEAEHMIRMQATGNVFLNILQAQEKAEYYLGKAVQEFRRLGADREAISNPLYVDPYGSDSDILY